MEKGKIDIIIRKVDRGEWKRFRLACMTEDTNASEAIRRFIASFGAVDDKEFMTALGINGIRYKMEPKDD